MDIRGTLEPACPHAVHRVNTDGLGAGRLQARLSFSPGLGYRVEPMKEGATHVGPASVHWRKDGDGPAIVFVHGFPLAGATWDEVIRRLRERFTCYTLDLIGLGQSRSASGEDYSSPGQARAFQATLSALAIERYALVGNDTGGWIARELALVDAQRVSHLILTNTEIPFHRPPWIPLYQALAHMPLAGAAFRLLLRSRTFRRSPLAFGGCFHDPDLIDGNFHQRFVAPLIATPDRMAGAMEFLRRMKFSRLDEFHSLHGRLTMPTLFVWGADDPTFPQSRARAMLSQFPNVRGFHAIAKARLFVYEEHPQAVADLIQRFLSEGRQ
jgi:pimeloyl-ACP methyl ester carboxylesterase